MSFIFYICDVSYNCIDNLVRIFNWFIDRISKTLILGVIDGQMRHCYSNSNARLAPDDR